LSTAKGHALVDLDFSSEWLVDAFLGLGEPKPSRARSEPRQPSRTYAPPRAAAKARGAPSSTAGNGVAAVSSSRKPRRPRQPPPSAPRPPPFDFNAWRTRVAEDQARLEPRLQAMPGTPEPFRVLGAPYPCTAEQLRARWRRLVFQYHPDRGGNLKQFIELKATYEEAVAILVGRPLVFRWRA